MFCLFLPVLDPLPTRHCLSNPLYFSSLLWLSSVANVTHLDANDFTKQSIAHPLPAPSPHTKRG
jgi:hypothetical protein